MKEIAFKYFLIFSLIIVSLNIIKESKLDLKIQIIHKFEQEWHKPLKIQLDK